MSNSRRRNKKPEVKNEISDILNLLEKEKNIMYSEMKNVILILGGVRSGKKIFTQFIAEKSNSAIRKTSKNTSNINDTILPILIKDTEHDVTIVDCPAFSDDAVRDIIGAYFIKNIIDSSDSLKLVFTIDRSDIRNYDIGPNLMLLLNHAVKLVKNLHKFKDSMALIVTNVADVSKAEIANIANILQNKKPNIQNRAVKQLLDNLLIKDIGGNYARIGIFRKPNKAFTSMAYWQNNKNLLKTILHKNLKFSTYNERDFAYTIDSDSSNSMITDLIDKINKNIVLDINKIGQEIENNYYNKEKASLNIHDLHAKFVEGNRAFSNTKAAGMQCTNTQCLTNKITQNIINLDINVFNQDLSSVTYYWKFLEFIKYVNNESDIITPEQWSQGLTNTIAYLNDSKNWYLFLVLFEDALSVYDVQKYIVANRMSFVGLTLTSLDEHKKLVLNALKSILQGILGGKDKRFEPLFKAFSDAKNVKLNKPKVKFFNLILDITFRSNVSITCDDSRGVIKGKYVMLSSISGNGCERSKSIEILALHTIYIDTNINRTYDQVQLSIVAPRWEVIALQEKTFRDDQLGHNSAIVTRDSYRYIHLSGKNRKIRANEILESSELTSILEKSVAGNFIGLSQSVTNYEYLKIIADGGMVFNSSRIPCRYQAEIDFSYNNNNRDQAMFNNTCKITYKHQSYARGRCTLHPKNCYNPTDIPDGDILFIKVEEQPNVKMNKMQGLIGYSGNGCRENNEGTNKNCVEIDFERYYGGEKWPLYQYGYYAFLSRTYSTDIDQLNPNSKVASHLPTVINHYKNYARENLIYDVSNPLIRTFLNQIDEYDFYTTLDFVNELKDLEEQFYDLPKELSLLPFYQSLLHRVQRYAGKRKKNEGLKSDEKKILNYLCTAILSSINSVNNDLVNDFSRNLPLYFDEAIDKIRKIQKQRDVTIKYSHYEYYQQQIKDKITEVVKIIQDEIIPELNSIFPDIEEKIESMVSETLRKIEDLKDQREVLVKKGEELASALKWRYVGLSIKIFSVFLGFLGPVGAIAGAVIGGSTMVAESLLLDDPGSLGIDKTVTLPAAVKNSITRITEEYKKKETIYKRKLYKAEQDLKNYLKEDSSTEPSDSIQEIKKKISDTKVKYDNEDKNGIALDKKSIERKQKYKAELAELLQQKKTLLEEKKTKSGINVDRKLNILTHVQAIVGIAEIGVDTYSKIKNNEAKINSVNDALAEVDASIGALKNYETEIYKVIMPIGKEIKENVKNALKNLAGLSKAAITLSGWRLKNALRDSEIQLQENTEGYSVQKDLSYCIEKLQYGISVVLEMYTHIQRYEEMKQLADFIANINLRRSKNIVINDPDLNTALAQLKFIIQSNFILDKYENSVNAFQQHVFPLAHYYLASVDLPPLYKPNELNHSVENIEEIIDELKTNINKYEHGRNKHISHKYSNTEFGCNSPWPPFFVWKFDKHKPDIHKLLEGKEVYLKSDVRQGINQNAIKFNKIGIRFILANKAKQGDLDELLLYFRLTIKHLGTSYYRCNDKFFKITTKDTDVISYVFKPNCSDRPYRPNRIYDDIAMREPVLSPYALWSVQLTEDGGDFNSLSEYKNEKIDLELHGKGEYMDLNLTICQNNLNKYYEEDDIPAEVNFVNINDRAKLYERSSSVRSRRSIQENYSSIDRSSIATNDGCSNVKSSFINKFFNIIGNSLMILKYWMPENDASQWFVNYNDDANNEKLHFNHHNEMKPSNIQLWQKELPNGPANDESPNVEKITNSYLFCTNSNLFLLDSLIRWKNGMKHKQQHFMMRNYFDVEHAQHLAYAGYAPQDN